MKLPRINLKKSLVLLFICTLITYLVFYFFISENLNKNESASPTSGITTVTENVSAISLPVRLKIPNIDIDVDLEYVGITANNIMDIPKSTDKVGWFELGTRPGEIGTAVMAGHYGLYAGKPSVFDNLNKLVKGDKISVEDENGNVASFVVRETRSYEPTADATDVFSSDDEQSHLNLITCEGTWSRDTKSFSKRLVVFADKE